MNPTEAPRAWLAHRDTLLGPADVEGEGPVRRHIRALLAEIDRLTTLFHDVAEVASGGEVPVEELPRALGVVLEGAARARAELAEITALLDTAHVPAHPDLLQRLTLLVDGDGGTKALADVIAERERQRSKGYDAAHDDEHGGDELSATAAALAHRAQHIDAPAWARHIQEKWADDRRMQLVIAAALLIAEIERWDRAEHVTSGAKP